MNPEPEAEDIQPVEVVYPDHPPVVDEFLWSYVKAANTGLYDGSFNITLFVQGTIICGMVIGERTYLSRVADRQSEGVSFPNLTEPVDMDEVRNSMRKGIMSHASDQEQYQNDIDASYFIHLSGVTIIKGDNWLKCDLWRGKLSRVDGFAWGAFNQRKG